MMLLMTLLVGDEGDDDSFRGWWCWLMVTVTRSKKTTAPWQEPSVYLQLGFDLICKLPKPANRTFEKWLLFLIAFQQYVSHTCKQKRHRILTNTNTQIRFKYLVDHNWTTACASDLDPTKVKGNVFADHFTLLPSYGCDQMINLTFDYWGTIYLKT